MTRYTEYKDAGIGKVGLVPNHWEVERIGNLFQEISDRYDATTIDALPLLSVSEYYGVAKRSEKIAEDGILVRAESLDGYKICQPGDIVSNIMLTWKGALGSSPCDGIVSPAYCIYRAKRDINSRYYHYLFRTKAYTDVFHVHSTGLIDSRLRLYTPKFFALYAPVPTIGEQNAIVDYLDEAAYKIDALIAEAKASIEEYKAWKASIIYEAVTKGLDPNAEMKDSDVVWIGDIPTHWKRTQIKYGYDTVLGKMLCPEQRSALDTYENYLCAANVKWLGVNTSVLKQMWFSQAEKEHYLVNDGDVLVMEGGMAGTACIYRGEFSPCYIQNSVHKCSAKDENLNEFLYYWLYFVYHIGYIDSICNRATIQHYTGEKLDSTPLLLPPVEEQGSIVEYLDKKISNIDALIAEKEVLITDLESYKKSLIFEVVTGKRKVV